MHVHIKLSLFLVLILYSTNYLLGDMSVLCFCTSYERGPCLLLSRHSFQGIVEDSHGKQRWPFLQSRRKVHLLSSIVALKITCVTYLAFWIICSMIIVYLLSQKPLNNGLISKKFNGSFMVPVVHRHLVLLHVGIT